MCQASCKTVNILSFSLQNKTKQNYSMQVLIQNYGIGIIIIPFIVRNLTHIEVIAQVQQVTQKGRTILL